MSVATIRSTMTERELRLWMAYAAEKMLPTRRLEAYLAQIALVVARCVGSAEDISIADFLFDAPKTKRKRKDNRDMTGLIGVAAGIGVRRLGQKRPRNG